MKTKSTLTLIVSMSAAILLSASLQAQAPTPGASPSRSPFAMPNMGAMYSQMMSAMFAEYIKPERATQLAHFQKLYYDALVKEGFTKEEAIEIVKGSQPPLGVAK